MHVIQDNKLTFFDCDDTLINYNAPFTEGHVVVECKNRTCLVNVLHDTVRELKRHYNQGQTICVWSGAGYQWAEAVVKALGLESYVHFVMNKPTYYYDDMPCETWMGKPRTAGDRR